VFGVLEVLRVEVEVSFPVKFVDVGEDIARRRADLAHLYNSLPRYDTPEFWSICEQRDIPLEILVKIARFSTLQKDFTNRARAVDCIMRRIMTMNERWALYILKPLALNYCEYHSLAYDLCAELCLTVMRAIFDPERVFWEENFRHCLEFERKHVYRSVLMREGRWQNRQQQSAERIPRSLIVSLDQLGKCIDNSVCTLDLEDKQAQKNLHAIEHDELFGYVLLLPERLKVVVLLLFWEEHSAKEIAQLLNITDRAVRYRLQTALQYLRTSLETGENAATASDN
jgi:RNA polymerase sigma factor (sigma-70 family)